MTTVTQARPITTEYKYTDVGDADRLVARFKDEIRYVPGWGWMHFDGRRWQVDDAGQVVECAKAIPTQMRIEAALAENETHREALWAWAKCTERVDRIHAMMDLAKSDPRIRARTDDFDKDPYLLNVENGTLNLLTGKIEDHCPDDKITKLSPVTYNPDATFPLWDGWLKWVTCNNQELEEYLQKAVGWTLTGDISEKVYFVLYGPTTNNGKTTLLNILQYILGDYGKALDDNTLLKNKGNKALRNDLAMLAGARYVHGSEPDGDYAIDTELIKRITGGDSITCKHLYKDLFSYGPQMKIWLSANNRPTIEDTGEAIWGRVRMLPFDARFAEKDPELPKKLEEQAPAILAWAVKGCQRWHKDRLGLPEVVRETSQDYRSEMDFFQAFLADKCGRAPERVALAKDVYAAYEGKDYPISGWRRLAGLEYDAPELTRQKFHAECEKHGYKVKPGAGNKRQVHGLYLLAPETPPPDEEPRF